MKFWIDVTALPHVHFFREMIRKLNNEGHDVLVTSRDFGIMNEILDRDGIEYTSVGSHGGKDLESKLIHSSERIIKLANVMKREKPAIGISKHSIESARVCFGLGIPSVMVIDHETAAKQSRLTVPLADIVVAPEATDIRKLKSYGSREVRQFNGVCEVTHFSGFTQNENVLKNMGLKKDDKIVIARSEPVLSSHNFHRSMLFSVLGDLKDRFDDLKIVFIPRDEDDNMKPPVPGIIIPEHSIDTLSLYSFADLMIGAGSCMNREAAVGGCPTISICPDNLPGVDRFMVEKGMMFHSLKRKEIVEKAAEMLASGYHRHLNGKIAKGFDDPHKKIMEAVRSLV